MDVKSKGQQKVDHFFPPLSLSPLRWVVEIEKTKKKQKNKFKQEAREIETHPKVDTEKCWFFPGGKKRGDEFYNDDASLHRRVT